VIGQLRHRVTLEAPVATADGGGGADLAWAPVATVWARLRAQRATAGRENQATVQVVSHEVTLRWRGDVTPRMRLVYEGRVLEIRSVRDPDETKRWLVLVCEERAA
jgi:SPP1 family predicted phage head-tail adaptor